MALDVQLWLNECMETLFTDNGFLDKSTNLNKYVQGTVLHIPSSGGALTVTKNRASWPITGTQRSDVETTMTMASYDTGMLFTNITESNQFSFDKARSIMDEALMTLKDKVATDVLYSWVNNLPSASIIATTGAYSGATSATNGQTGARKIATYDDFVKMGMTLSNQNVPNSGRVIVVTPGFWADIQKSLTGMFTPFITTGLMTDDKLQKAGYKGALLNCPVFERAPYVFYNSSGTTGFTEATGQTSCSEFAIMYHESMVGHAFGTKKSEGVELFVHENDPAYQATTFSFYVRAQGTRMRYDDKGIVALYASL